MAKITVTGRPEDMERGFQIANETYKLLDGVERAGHLSVEIIKVTTRRGTVFHLLHTRYERVWGADFQIVCRLPSLYSPYSPPKQQPQEDNLKLKACWEGNDDNLVVFEEHHGGRCLGSLELKEKEVEDFAKALVKATQLGIQHRQSCLERLTANLASTIKAPEFEVEIPLKVR